MRLDITFNRDGSVKGFKFNADTLTLTFGGVLVVTAQDFDIDTDANASDPKARVAQFGSIGAKVKIGSLEIAGQANNFGFDPNGNFQPGDPNNASKQFGVVLSVEGTSGSALGWPSWLPIKINAIGIQWADIENDPADFELTLSASVTGLPAVAGLRFSGSIEGVHIKPSLLLEGKFPITRIDSFGVSIAGNLFGGEINGALIGGILRIKGNQIMADTDNSDPDDRVLFVGVQGGLSMGGIGG